MIENSSTQGDIDIFGEFHILRHALIGHKLFHLRDPNTHTKEFNRLLKEIAMLMAYEVTRDFPTEEKTVNTGFGKARGRVISGKKAVLVPLLRAGICMVDGLNEAMASSKMGHIGLYKQNGEVLEYLVQLPAPEDRTFILVDPMMGTGKSACKAIEILLKNGSLPEKIKFVSLIVSRQAVELVSESYPKVRVYAVAVDPGVNAEGRVTPGLGYIGQRLFGTP